MMKNRICFLLVGIFFLVATLPVWTLENTAAVKGKVTDGSKPVADVQVVYTNIDNGRKNKAKTDSHGEYVLVGLAFGNFKAEVLGPGGEVIATRNSLRLGEVNNVVDIDMKNPNPGGDTTGTGPDSSAPAPKLTKEQLAKMEADNKKIAGLNSLITEAQNARQAQDWPKEENALKQLIAAAPDTSRWDFYMFLGEAESKSNKQQEAIASYDKGIQAAQSVMSGSTPANPKIPPLNPAMAKTGASRMLTSQANAYLKLQKTDEAITSLKKAAELDPASALASYNLCGVAFSAQKLDIARSACNKYLQIEPAGPHADDVKAFLAQMGK